MSDIVRAYAKYKGQQYNASYNSGTAGNRDLGGE